MYVRVPEELKQPLLADLRRYRLRSALLYFPVLVLIFSAIALLVVIAKGHALMELLRDEISPNVADSSLLFWVAVATILLTIIALVFFLWQHNRDCDYQDCPYCAKCDALDPFDNGHCPVCSSTLSASASFYFTTDKDEIKILDRWGLKPSRTK